MFPLLLFKSLLLRYSPLYHYILIELNFFLYRWHKVNLADKEVPFDFIGQLLEMGTNYLSLCWSNLHTRLIWDVFPRKNHPLFEGDSDEEEEVKRYLMIV